ncbi:MAG: PKD domain-containing protein [Comamonadaceae bacterium]|nr:PKD domain-containing protein [Comamonadaceae bacterium]
MLNRTVFESGVPVAVAKATPNPAVAGQIVQLDGSTSFHQDGGKLIDSWEWDLDNDGAFDDACGPVRDGVLPRGRRLPGEAPRDRQRDAGEGRRDDRDRDRSTLLRLRQPPRRAARTTSVRRPLPGIWMAGARSTRTKGSPKPTFRRIPATRSSAICGTWMGTGCMTTPRASSRT